MENYNKWMQYFWLIIALASGTYAVFSFFTAEGEPVDILVYIMPLLAFVLFLIRFYHRKKLKSLKEKEKSIDQQD